MATYSVFGYDDDQIVFPGSSPSLGETVTFDFAANHELVFDDNDTSLQDGTDDRDDEDSNQLVTVYDEFGAVETSGQVQPRQRVVLDDGTNTHVMHRVYIASSNSYYYVFEDPPPALNTTYTVTSVTSPNSTPYANFSESGVACFTRGTQILTPQGQCCVERLRVGMQVLTLDHGAQPVVWTGHCRITGAECRRTPNLGPFLVRAGALGPDGPDRDILLSRQHRVLVSGPIVELHTGTAEVLVPVHALAGLPGVAQAYPPFGLDYYHFATHRHEIVLANGIAAETLLVTDMRDADDAMRGRMTLPADLRIAPQVAARMALTATAGRDLVRFLSMRPRSNPRQAATSSAC